MVHFSLFSYESILESVRVASLVPTSHKFTGMKPSGPRPEVVAISLDGRFGMVEKHGQISRGRDASVGGGTIGWGLMENGTRKAVVPSALRVGILLSGAKAKDDPVLFDPKLKPTNKPMSYGAAAKESLRFRSALDLFWVLLEEEDDDGKAGTTQDPVKVVSNEILQTFNNGKLKLSKTQEHSKFFLEKSPSDLEQRVDEKR
ncbi:hypothetical protein NHQ30_009877 [Ciborinia camelliae]|nr:hypothetical protein NHQ30_009877 [Ciborinia camelliae]